MLGSETPCHNAYQRTSLCACLYAASVTIQPDPMQLLEVTATRRTRRGDWLCWHVTLGRAAIAGACAAISVKPTPITWWQSTKVASDMTWLTGRRCAYGAMHAKRCVSETRPGAVQKC